MPLLPHSDYKLQVLFLASNLSIETAAKLFPPINKIRFPPFPSPPFLVAINNSNNRRLQTRS